MCKKRLYVFMAAVRNRCGQDIIVSSCGFFTVRRNALPPIAAAMLALQALY